MNGRLKDLWNKHGNNRNDFGENIRNGLHRNDKNNVTGKNFNNTSQELGFNSCTSLALVEYLPCGKQ